MIQADAVAIDVGDVADVADVIGDRSRRPGSGQIRQRDIFQQRHGTGIEARRGDAVAGEWRAGERIVDYRETGKIAVTHGRGRNRESVGPREPFTEPFVIAKEKRSLAAYRSPERESELVPVEGRLGRACGEEVLGRIGLVAVEQERGAMEGVGARFCDNRDGRGPLKLGPLVIGIDLELADRVDRRERGAAVTVRVCRASVAGIVIRGAVDVELDSTPVGTSGHSRIGSAVACDAGRNSNEAIQGAPVQRQCRYHLALHDISDRGAFRVHDRSRRLHLDLLGKRPGFEDDVESHCAIRQQPDSFCQVLLEARGLCLDRVDAGTEVGCHEVSRGIRLDPQLDVRALVDHGHGGSGHHAAGAVFDGAHDRGGDALSDGRRCENQQKNQADDSGK